ncbi:low affinity iron permease family protein [Bradyrhizobium liaoningense]|uniref:low affinity iron permease family protein n=1 Tax=Bradyrhizobium liaoningense TaxID=43992 RepID=UPI001BA72793|nr:low affinity iron permease family protein [Bradyrhizobium liaoningense]MBR0823858.1 low affinity iron permease family protein [Bradyrhizobium liaoningense]
MREFQNGNSEAPRQLEGDWKIAPEEKVKARGQSHWELAPLSRFFGELANRTSIAAGRASTFLLAVGVVIVWAFSGPIFHFSDTWQLVINTGTTIVTFLMVFLIQNSQNRDSAAIQVKLDELIRVGAARNSLVGIEHLSDDELEEIRTKCEARAAGDRSVADADNAARQAAERISS